MSNLKVGDTLYRFHMGRVVSKATIERITKTKIILSDKSELRNSGNDRYLKRINAGTWDTTHYSVSTPEIEEKYKRMRVETFIKSELAALTSMPLDNCSYEQLSAIAQAIDSIKVAIK